MSAQLLHFTLSPVQSFIGQARRTRDLWAGSFLLSWLSGTAMRAIVDGGHGRIAFPNVATDPLFLALGAGGDGPTIGSLPNRFKALIDQPERFDPDRVCRAAVLAAWRRLADAVWRHFVAPRAAALGDDSAAIWRRQTDLFWETAWVIGAAPADGSDGGWLDRRKNWRSDRPAVEGGDHCLIMGDRQELSGHVRFHAAGRQGQDAFWQALRQTVHGVLYPGRPARNAQVTLLELGQSERLCAIALIKRLFPLLPDDELRAVIGWVPDGSGRTLRKWPSTLHMAAVPWQRRAWRENEAACRTYAGLVGALRRDDGDLILAERAEQVPRVAAMRPMGAFGGLDGGLFFDDALGGDPILESFRGALLAGLSALRRALPDEASQRRRKMRTASPFHALLVMDGDRIGALLHEAGEARVSDALARFTGSVPGVVAAHDGVTIYAGGDDFLGLFPLPQALAAAAALADAYRAAWPPGAGATISAGLVFAQYGVPLATVIRRAHALLDETAKQRNGRDSIAVGVIKPSGDAMEWVSCWNHGCEPAGDGLVARLEQLARAFADDDQRSTSFIYNIRARYGDLLGGIDRGDRRAILLAERLKGKDLDGLEPPARRALVARFEAEIEQLLGVCQPLSRIGGGAPAAHGFALDGALIARFLADHGIWID